MILLHLGTTDSTQSFLKRHPELGYCGVMTDSQSAGRGRGGNSWESAPGAGLWLSARLPLPEISGGLVLQYAMAAVIEVLEPYGVRLGLKWPNDLVAYRQGALVKLGGIIGEQCDNSLILGLGLNIFSAPEIPERAIPPASLVSLGASELPEMPDLAKRILSVWQTLERERPVAFRWPDKGDEINWEDGCGTCQGWKSDGRLVISTESGPELLVSGDVISNLHHC